MRQAVLWPHEPKPSRAFHLVAPGRLDLAAQAVGGALGGLVRDDQVPVGRPHRGLVALAPRGAVKASDQRGALRARSAAPGRRDPFLGQEHEVGAERLPQLVLPPLDQVAGCDYETALHLLRIINYLQGTPATIVWREPGS